MLRFLSSATATRTIQRHKYAQHYSQHTLTACSRRALPADSRRLTIAAQHRTHNSSTLSSCLNLNSLTTLTTPARSFSTSPIQLNSDSSSTPSSLSSGFHSVGLSAPVCSAVHNSLQLQQPTGIQRVAIPAILQGSHVHIAEQTGQGKVTGSVIVRIVVSQRLLCAAVYALLCIAHTLLLSSMCCLLVAVV